MREPSFILQILGMILVIWLLGNYVMGSIDIPEKQNKKLMDNMNKLEKR